jgi:uncharacterized protein YebE (UPF0316 family)
MDWNVVLGAAGIFGLRVVGNMITTFRLVLVVRGQRIPSTVLSAFEALIFAVALGSVVTNLNNPWNLAAYCVGFAVGGYLGMLLENRMVQRFVLVQVISPQMGHEIAVAIREAGYGATEGIGQGAQGPVGSVSVAVGHHHVNRVVRVIQQIDPDAFVMTEELRAVSRGYFRLMRQER